MCRLTAVTLRVSLVTQELLIAFRSHVYASGLFGVLVVYSLVFCVAFCWPLFVLSSLFFLPFHFVSLIFYNNKSTLPIFGLIRLLTKTWKCQIRGHTFSCVEHLSNIIYVINLKFIINIISPERRWGSMLVSKNIGDTKVIIRSLNAKDKLKRTYNGHTTCAASDKGTIYLSSTSLISAISKGKKCGTDIGLLAEV